MNNKVAIVQQVEVNDLERLDIECEESKIYSDNAEGAKLSADILDKKADEFEENGDTLNAKKVGKQAMKNYIESVELNQKAILASDVGEDVFEIQGFKNLDKAKHSHNNEAINKVLESKDCNVLLADDIDKIKNLFSSKKSPYNECRYGAEFPEHSKRKDIKEIAEKVDKRKKKVEDKIKKSKIDKNEIVLKGGLKIVIKLDKDN